MGSPVKDGEKGGLEDLLMEAGLKGPTPVGSLISLYRALHVVKGDTDDLKGEQILSLRYCLLSGRTRGLWRRLGRPPSHIT